MLQLMQHASIVVLNVADILIIHAGAFVGCSLEGSIVATRAEENSRFYGNPSICASTILLGSLPRPPAAVILYHALSDLFEKVER